MVNPPPRTGDEEGVFYSICRGRITRTLEGHDLPRVVYLALADNVPRPPSNCPNGMNQPSISPRIRFFGASCNPGDRSQAHQSCLVSRSSPHPLFTPPAAAAMVAPETSALLAASTRGRSIQRPSLAYTAATTSPSHCRWSSRKPATAGASSYVAGQSCGRCGTPLVDAASRPHPGTAC